MGYISPSASNKKTGVSGYVSPTDEVIKSSIDKSVGSANSGYISPAETSMEIKPYEVAAGETRDVPKVLRKQVRQTPVTPDIGVSDVVREVPGVIKRGAVTVFDTAISGIRSALDAVGKVEARNDQMALELVNMQRTANGRAPFKTVQEMDDASPIKKILNTPRGKKVLSGLVDNTSDLGIKALAGVGAIADSFKDGSVITKTAKNAGAAFANPALIPAMLIDSASEQNYKKYYDQLVKDKQDPNNSAALNTLYSIQDAVPQTLTGMLLYAAGSRISPTVGRALSSTYFAGISAGSQVKESGKVNSLTNIAIDVAGDELLGGVLEGIFKKPVKSVVGSFIKGFGTEGGTEVAQTLLKYGNDYKSARTPEEKAAVVEKARNYVTNGGLLQEFIVGGIAGGGIAGAGAAVVPGTRIDENATAQSFSQPTVQEAPAVPVSGYVSPSGQTNTADVEKSQALDQDIGELEVQIQLAQERLADHPGKKLIQYKSNKTGELPEVGRMTPEERKAMEIKRQKNPLAKSFKGNYDQILSPETMNSQEYGTTYGEKDPNDAVREYEALRDSIPALQSQLEKLQQVRDSGDVSGYTPPVREQTNYRDDIEFSRRKPAATDSNVGANVKTESVDKLVTEAKKYNSAEEFVNNTPKTVNIWRKSRFSNDGAMVDYPVIRKEDNITLYQGGEGGQHWTADKKYAEQFGDVKEKTGSFYQIDNGNRMTNVYVEAPTKSQLTEIWNTANKSNTKDQLSSEAKKYNTAEEFVKTRGELLYHGTGSKFDTFNTDIGGTGGLFFTNNYAEAQSFAEGKYTGNTSVKEVYVNLINPAPISVVNEAFSKATGGNPQKMAFDILKSQGYDGFKRPGGETVVFFTDRITTKDQLTEIWKKANPKPKATKTTEDAAMRREPKVTPLSETKPAKNIEEMVQRIEQLNKFGQSNAILRRTGRLGGDKLGVFRGVGKNGEVKLQNNTVINTEEYMSVLAHELGHALEHNLVGKTNVDTYRVFGRDLPGAIKARIKNELKDITIKIEGADVVSTNEKYYYKDTELLARFFQYMFENPGDVETLAPTATEYIQKSAIETPIIAEYLEAVSGTIDKGAPKLVFLRDMRQTYQKYLGKRVGNMAWNDEVRYRNMKERAKYIIEKSVKSKFKGIEDSPEALFNAAEGIKVTENNVPVFGTRDFQWSESKSDDRRLAEMGYTAIKNEDGGTVTEMVDGKERTRYAKVRYTEEQGRQMYEALTPEGKKLIREFTAQMKEAKDFFNRETIKDMYKINGDIEGWVHHYFEEDGKSSSMGGDKLKDKIAGGRRKRTGTDGYVKDLQKAMQKSLTEFETEKQYNQFIGEFFARVTEPIAMGQMPKPGYTEVAGNLRFGVGRPQEINKAGKAEIARYQMPTDIYRRYQLISGLADEAGLVARTLNSINRYWRVNVLFHMGSTFNNFVGGGLQYGSKIMVDFYTELLSGNFSFENTRNNIYAMYAVATPKGWQDAPDWVYGGDESNYYSEFGTGKAPGLLDKTIDAYADKSLALYQGVERYWKKVLSYSAGAKDLKHLNEPESLGRGMNELNELEKQIMDDIEKETDLYGFNYNNVPVWLENFNRSALGSAVKPFTKYPYKYTKLIANLVGAIFDRSLPWQERAAKAMTLGTIMAIYAYVRSKRKEEQETKEVPETAPPSVSTRGRLFVGTDDKGNELFTRVAKYPFLNLTEAGAQFIDGNTNQGYQLIADQIGSVAPAGKIALSILGYRNEYEQFQPYPAILGKDLASFIPGTRILADISRFFDPYQRKQETFMQGLTSLIPTTDPERQLRLHGPQRTIRVPVEGEIKRKEGEKKSRTTTDMEVLNYKSDILLSAFTGIYISRINPDVANAFIVRDEENKAKEEKKKKREED